MDIHLDRWLEHIPTPPDMPDGEGVSYLAMLGSDLRRVWWGAWGDPRGFVPKMADYFKLCNIAKSDARAARSDRRAARAASSSARGSACGAARSRPAGTSGIRSRGRRSRRCSARTRRSTSSRSGSRTTSIERIERFTQSIGDCAVLARSSSRSPATPSTTQVATLSDAFVHFTGAPLDAALVDRFRAVTAPQFALAVRIRGGTDLARRCARAGHRDRRDIERLCADAKVQRRCRSSASSSVRSARASRASSTAAPATAPASTSTSSPASRRARRGRGAAAGASELTSCRAPTTCSRATTR